MIRGVRQDDAAALAAIYAPYVERTWISFEEVPPSADDMRAKLLAGIQTYPWLIEEHNGEVATRMAGCIADAQLIAGRWRRRYI